MQELSCCGANHSLLPEHMPSLPPLPALKRLLTLRSISLPAPGGTWAPAAAAAAAASATATSPATSDAAATAAVLQLQYGPLSADFLEKHARVERRVTGQQAYMEQEKALAQAAGGPSRTRNVH